MPNDNFTIVIHGGAGTILRANMTEERETGIRATLAESLKAGYDMLAGGGRALDAVQASVMVMEDSPHFNAGKGAVYTHEGGHEQDAAVMDGATRDAGAVAGITRIASPISLARLVMDTSPHLLLGGAGAEKFAEENGVTLIDDQSYFDTEFRYQQWQQALAREKATNKVHTQLDHSDDEGKVGTVGAVALDKNGDLAAATSTGGMTNKRYGRIGDTPVIGAGVYADNNTCAVSSTGVGESIMRAVFAYDVAALMEYKGLTLKEASDLVVMEKFKAFPGDAGLIAIDRQGNFVMPFNSAGMYRGYMLADGTSDIAIYES